MKKKRLSKLVFIGIIVFSLLASFGLFLFFHINASSHDIDSGKDVENIEKDPIPQKNDFAKSNLDIKFSLEQKMYMLVFSKNTYFKVNEFKYYFFLEFNKLGPKSNDVNLEMFMNDKEKPTKITVQYKCANKIYTWYFKLN
ncbi:hypothetical protein [Spiroplasma sp. BIUS-1]|uniref:hypothetical protein n=1 Tax=Spiroplasma sp. BIUS-1 TaxID=216964 RepID=UPI00139720A4|nr:hypothetical protein [Spiroplasma sp. BIUS-1]QHX36968.1 hypothetical protein SBIUS_v1c07150 [Spiroplasma sp. BIUS-1]